MTLEKARQLAGKEVVLVMANILIVDNYLSVGLLYREVLQQEKIKRVSQDCEPEIPSSQKEVQDAFKTASVVHVG